MYHKSSTMGMHKGSFNCNNFAIVLRPGIIKTAKASYKQSFYSNPNFNLSLKIYLAF